MKITQQPIVWSIAGSDCTSGAGIQADLKTIHNLSLNNNSTGLAVGSVITAVTAQNSLGVEQINAVSEDVLLSQINALAQEKPAKVIKIGLLANKQQVELISQQIANFKNNWQTKPFVIYDPVAIASNGGNLTEDDILPTIKEKLLPLVDLLTPNGKEVEKLTGVVAFSWDCLITAAQKILDLGVGATIIKGGHIDIAKNKSVDFFADQQQQCWLSSDRINTQNSHGTGCTFASAIAAIFAQGYALKDAFVIAKAYINQGLNIAKKLSDNRAALLDTKSTPSHAQTSFCQGAVYQGGWPNNINDYPKVLVAGSSLADSIGWPKAKPELLSTKQEQLEAKLQNFYSNFASVRTSQTSALGLYPVVDSISWLERLLKEGVSIIQYREKKRSGDDLESAIKQAIALGKQYNARLFINDHWQLAIKHNAYGVHLGQEDIQTADLNAIKSANLRLGISTHGHYELLKVQQYKPSYLAIGAIFPTKTKDMTGQIQGVHTLKQLVDLTPHIPTVAIGGITLEKAPSVLNTNADSIAVVTAITEASNPEYAVDQFQQLFLQLKSKH